MDVQALYQLVDEAPGGNCLNFALRRALVDRVASGETKAAEWLVPLAGLAAIPALIEAGAPAPALQAAIGKAIYSHYHELRSVERALFAAWCRTAAFRVPPNLPEMVNLYRGTMGVSPAVAATGLHWAARFESAALFACRFADTDLTGCIVIHARVPRDEIVCFAPDSVHGEMIPARAPAVFDVITDKERIGGAALREAARQQEIQAHFGPALSFGLAEQVAMRTRARMTAAGVPRGAAIVA